MSSDTSSSPVNNTFNFEYYNLQIGGHGASDDTGLISLFDGKAIAKPLLIGQRGITEAAFYRDLAIAYHSEGDVQQEKYFSNTNNNNNNNNTTTSNNTNISE
eukprot:UN10570